MQHGFGIYFWIIQDIIIVLGITDTYTLVLSLSLKSTCSASVLTPSFVCLEKNTCKNARKYNNKPKSTTISKTSKSRKP